MSDWLRRFQHSRRARNAAFGAIAVVSLGSCAGAVMANYTVAGMNTLPYVGEQYAQSDWRSPEPEWERDATMVATGDTDGSAGFSSATTDVYGDATN